ncbi:MAG TPA: condensation domain-containing protein, partial [Pyrinomonadaceae bacterium]
SGAQLVLARPGGHQDSGYLVQTVKQQEITILQLVPSMLRVLLEEDGLAECVRLRRVYCGGELLSKELQERFFALLPEVELHNLYGPTEVSIDATHWQCQAAVTVGVVPIGRPLTKMQVYVLDQQLQLVPVGVAGEIYIGGAGLARGYQGRAELTAERFIPHPYSRELGARLYRSGDVGRYLETGVLEYLGRVDDQVKVRGCRIELGEVETTLRSHEEVAEAVVLLREDRLGNQQLVAYIVAREADAALSSNRLRAYLSRHLPDYMIPGSFVPLQRMPRTLNGKIDRHALPPPNPEFEELTGEAGTPTEELLTGIWSQLLGIERVGTLNDFFELGGHSLLATQIVSRVREVFNVELPLRAFFESPTVSAMATIIDSLRQTTGVTQVSNIQPTLRSGPLPLSLAQERLWLFHQLEVDSVAYNAPTSIRLRGNLNQTVFERSINEIVRRHEVLRTHFACVNEEPVQIIVPELTIKLPSIDLRESSQTLSAAKALRMIIEDLQQPFDLTKGPLWRGSLLQIADDEFILMLTLHHIIGDAWSTDVFIRELATFYEDFCAGNLPSLPALPVQYGDYAVWEREWLKRGMPAEQLSYWQRQLAGAPPLLTLRPGQARPAVQSYQGAHQKFLIAAEVEEGLKNLSRQEGVTLFMTLLAGFQTLLHFYSGQDDIVVGTDVANRSRAEVEGVIGFFVNQLVLRTDLSGGPTWRELLGRVREVALGAYAHQDVPFDKLVEVLNPARNLSYAPLFQVKLVLRNKQSEERRIGDLEWEMVEVETGTAQFDLVINMMSTAAGLTGIVEYNTGLFDAAWINRMLGHYQLLLSEVVAQPEIRLSHLQELLASADKQQQVVQETKLVEMSLNKLRTAKRREILEMVDA